MFIYENQVGCIEVEDVNKAIRDYEMLGCSATKRENNGCATLGCPDGELYVCEGEDEIVGG